MVFKYAANGLRTTKEEWNGTTLSNITKYYYGADGLLAYETRTKDNIKLEYLYDAEGSLYGVYYNGTPYYYVKDALGTITHLVDANKNIVTEFVYDGAYGVHSTTNESSVSSTHITKVNPFRYKGYYYDVETQLFYCNSRYYSPELCRWISPDSIKYLDPESINGLNLYAYCMNNPVNYYDPTGNSALSILIPLLCIGISNLIHNTILSSVIVFSTLGATIVSQGASSLLTISSAAVGTLLASSSFAISTSSTIAIPLLIFGGLLQLFFGDTKTEVTYTSNEPTSANPPAKNDLFGSGDLINVGQHLLNSFGGKGLNHEMKTDELLKMRDYF